MGIRSQRRLCDEVHLNLSVNDRPTSRRELGRALAAAGARADDRLLLAADKTQTYQALMDIFDDLRAVGYTRVALTARER